ncbi:anthranilate phosphoribosyltransferase [Terrilactibacillus sp. BCM23-1]|uniref:Anthranilate phosphoribosyltransferase n=1 Tax=Terrilactibacillus tamarindi TaxID=2599694 RepID=A0A6N8CQR0_9BACI|nr:anthranilate phosphoribosyltransferase [Terrilactibacillus tamarindi]MTT31275.1 anthranilate phosphoribosyltransferase [Terrilactibacillus tamarindi]
MFKSKLSELLDGHKLTEDEAMYMMDQIMSGEVLPTQIASFLSILRFRGETIEEVTGFARAMRAHAKTFSYHDEVMDTCGTGGDNASTFNISTAVAIVLSSLGVNIAKHGNRSFSSKSGSADVLETLGISIQSTPEEAVQALDDKNMCFLFAPLFHASMKHAAGPRKELGFRTVFNILGPLANPANSSRQLLGVFNYESALKMAHALSRLGTKRALLVNGEDGLDEISICGRTNMVLVEGDKVKEFKLQPEDVGLERGSFNDLKVSNSQESAALIEAIFKGEGNQSATDIVCLNAGAGLFTYGKVSTIEEGVHQARKAINQGTALEQLEKLRSHVGVERLA